MRIHPLLRCSPLFALLACVSVGCSRQKSEPVIAENPATPPPWTQPTEPGQWKIGNQFPELTDAETVAGDAWLSIGDQNRFIMIVGADQFVQRAENADWLRTIAGKHAESFRLALSSEDATNDRWGELTGDSEGPSITVVHASEFKSDKVGDKFLWPSGSNGMPRVFIVGEDRHIEWIGDIDADEDRNEFDRVLYEIAAGNWNRHRQNALFEEQVADYRDRRRMQLAVNMAIETEQYDDAIEILSRDLGDDPDFIAVQRSQLRYIARKAGRHDVLNEVTAAEAQAHADDAVWLAEAAYKMATGEEGNDEELATKLAEQSCELVEYKDARMLYSLAVTHAVRANYEEARKWALQAKEITEDDPLRQAADALIADLPEESASE